MRIWWMIAAVAALALGPLAAENVAPTKSELEEMYSKAFREFDANNFPQALKELDAIDARQPDLAASKNLRSVILMRQGIYDKAEAALHEAARIDPKFWNARFNLAEIPFLKKDWAEARRRFEELLSSSESDLAGEASQLIQYKILLTYLLEGKENMVDSILAKLELSRDTPAVEYVKAAVALEHKNQKEAKDWMAVAEKNFSPQLNKLFAESLYEVGWLERPAGEARASLPLTTAAERAEKGKALARSKFEQAQQALRQRDFAAAGKLIDEADEAEPNQPATLNLRGEILMEQKEFDQAEAAFKKAAKLDPKFREARYNLAQIPFKKKDYAKARERFEALFEQTPGGDKNQAAELMKFKIYMTLLLEGKESRAHAMMEQFQFTGDTPALYYAQAAWEFKHNNPEKAADWTASAEKIYSAALNSVFSDAFYDVGWVQRPEVAAAPAPALDTASVIAAQAEGSPAVEPSPIPDTLVAANKQGEKSKDESPISLALATNPPSPGMETKSVGDATEQPPVSVSTESAAAGISDQSEEAPAAAGSESASDAESTTATDSSAKAAASSPAPAGQNEQAAAGETKPSVASAVPTTLDASSYSPPGIAGVSRQTWLVGGLLLAGIFVLAWVVVPDLRRRYTFNIAGYPQARSMTSSPTSKRGIAPAGNGVAPGNGFFGGPRQVSLQLAASKPSLRHTALPSASAYHKAELSELPPVAEPVFESTLEPVVERTAESLRARAPKLPPLTEPVFEPESVGPVVVEHAGKTLRPRDPELPSFVGPAVEPVVGSAIEPPPETLEPSVPQAPDMVEVSAVSRLSGSPAMTAEKPIEVSRAEEIALPAKATSAEPEVEPTGQKHPLPHEAVVTPVQSPVAEAVAAPAPDIRAAISAESEFPQTTTPATMPETTQIPSAPVNKPSAAPATKPQPAATMQTSVQLTFSFEIAVMQLTPSFKMGGLKVRPISKLVTMRLPSSQQPQPAMNLQVSFEIAKIQPIGGALGTIRMLPSQQRPPVTGSSSVAVGGLQLVPNSEAAPVQLTASQPGQATVFVTVPCQITTIEFSPSLEIASVVLNSSSKHVRVQLPGAGPNPGEGAPTFEIANVQLGDNGDVAMMQLNLLGQGPKRT
jgi:Flp pilus assembly protein TadD